MDSASRLKTLEMQQHLVQLANTLSKMKAKHESIQELSASLTYNLDAAEVHAKLSFVYATLFLVRRKLEGSLKNSNKVGARATRGL